MKYLWLLVIVGALGGWHWWTTEREVARPPGILVPGEPLQRDIASPQRIDVRDYALYTRARYDITARVLKREIYRLDDGASLAPIDLGVGWGSLSDTRVIDALEFSQMGRFLYWRPKDGRTFPIPTGLLVTSAAQMHLIPASASLEARLRKLRPGQIVTIGGYLVDVRGPRGFVWNTSLTRTDTGNGACEIVFVESLDVE